MRRIVIVFLLLLLSVTSGVLYWQWTIYSEKSAEVKRTSYKASEMIRMDVTAKTIDITHEILGLPATSFVVKNPRNVKISCQENKKKCTFTDKQKTKIKTNGGTIKFTYTLRKPKADAYVLDNWALTLKDVTIHKTSVELTHHGKDAVTWAAGATLVGQTKKGKINYFVFEGVEGVFPLYFQKQVMKQVEEHGFVIYGDTSQKIIEYAKQYEVETPFTFIISTKRSSFSAEHLLIGRSKANIMQVLANRYYQKNYPFKAKEEKWLQSFIGVYVLDEQAEGKAKQLITELSKQLTEEQQTAFVALLNNNKGQGFSAARLDGYLSEVTGLKTNYFVSNKVEKNKRKSLVFINNAKWYDKQGNSSEIDSITKNSTRYYDLKQVAKKLGFEYEGINDDQIYLTNGKRSYRLFPGEKTFFYNGTAYSIKGDLLKKINNKYYVTEEYLPKIFRVIVREQDGELQLGSL